MRFAFKTSPQHTTWDAMLAVWRAADGIALFESGWTSDHFYPTHSPEPGGPRLEGWITLAALAQATRRLRLGTLVSSVHYRHPAVLANMAATLDAVSGGRLELGLGAGWNEEESGAYGMELGSPKERSDRFEEACEVVTSLLARDTTTFDGAYYRLRDARCDPKPVQRPHPPLCVGGSGEKRTLRTAARFAQHWNFDTGTVEQFTRARDVLHRHCADVGRDPAEILLSAQVRFTGDPAATAARAAELAAAGAQLAIVYLPPPHTPAVLEPLAAALAPLAG
ncbi:LLM class F420-dependent oxidoreductase [Actinacidiphila rubida]|uniref:Probable F420-dependent oxidoreductase, Rv1855c family n=1 Tax=Actinacidiphila rubida TaxID=310780 RepID=A0A1H8KUY7_9ACTN|nr:LLM class F420-dependent oxidoreductase [Actinacidiphila rubida]SEN96712.1 probable F420-dependent oxidoreductase, Rv1855c family [Actinacidiphila rubida]